MKPDYLAVAVAAARRAGAILKDNFGGSFAVKKKGAIDLVTEIDQKAEKVILEVISESFPDHGFLAEESGQSATKSEFQWVIDPLDGTTNYAHFYPCFCTSIALEIAGVLEVGVIYHPLLDELYTAERGKGAFLNGKRLKVSKTADLDNSLICTGFAYDVRANRVNNLAQFNAFLLRTQGLRRDGSAATDLSYVSAGRFDGFWEFNLNPWDMAAGALLILEAGGKLSKIDGSAFDLRVKSLLATNGVIHDQMLEILGKVKE